MKNESSGFLNSFTYFGGDSTRRVVMLLIAIIFYSCSTKPETPPGILSKDEMAKALTDLYLKEAKINKLPVGQDSILVLIQYYRTKYAASHNLPDSIVEKSYQYYVERPFEMGEIYDRIIDSLALREQRVEGGGRPVP